MYHNIEIQEIAKLIEKYNEISAWDIVYNISTVLMLLVSTISLIVSLKVYAQTARMHHQNTLLTKMTHADSLTPYVVIDKIETAATLIIEGYPELEVDKIDIGDKIVINDKVAVKINQIHAKVCTEFFLYNMLDIPAEISLNTSIRDVKQNKKLFVTGKERKTIKIDYEMEVDIEFMLKLSKSKATNRFNMEYTGPGMSANDVVNGTVKLLYSPDMKLKLSEDNIEKRERVYQEVDK